MKKILSLALVLMLALSLTVALADVTTGDNTLNLTANVTSDITDNTEKLANFDVAIVADDGLEFALDQADTQTGQVSNWDGSKYTDATHECTYELSSGESGSRAITVTNSGNMDVELNASVTGGKGFTTAFSISGNVSQFNLINITGEVNEGAVTVTLDPSKIDSDTDVEDGATIGTVTITLNPDDDLYSE